MNLQDILSTFTKLHNQLSQYSIDDLDSVSRRAEQENPWFTSDNFYSAYKGILMLIKKSSLDRFDEKYQKLDVVSHKIGLVSAGNIPGVGFHDILICLLSGSSVKVKLSSEDSILLPFILSELKSIDNSLGSRCEFVSKLILDDLDAVIATGSNNTARYFENYFSKKPNVIRKSRTSLAILTGEETDTDLESLCDDIISYFGLGCRNVSKILLQQDVDLIPLLQKLEQRTDLNNFSKYDNNYLYYKSIYLVNREEFLDTETILIKETEEMHAPISVLYYQRFETSKDIEKYIDDNQESIQCVVGNSSDLIPFGESQSPSILDYPDGVDIREFIDSL